MKGRKLRRILALFLSFLLFFSIFSILSSTFVPAVEAASIDFTIDLVVADRLQYSTGETVYLYARILNIGTVTITTAYANFTVIDPNGNVAAKRDREE